MPRHPDSLSDAQATDLLERFSPNASSSSLSDAQAKETFPNDPHFLSVEGRGCGGDGSGGGSSSGGCCCCC